VFTDPAYTEHWWGPKGLTVRFAKMDFRRAAFFTIVCDPRTARHVGKICLPRNLPQERIEFINSFRTKRAASPAPNALAWPLEMLTTFTFTENEVRLVHDSVAPL